MRDVRTRLIPALLIAMAAAACGGDASGPTEEPLAEDPARPAESRVTDMALAFQSTCALTADGKLHCWGENRFKEFGDGTQRGSSVAVPGASGLRLASVDGSIGTPQMCGTTDTGAGYCWGYNLNGELGNGHGGDYDIPRPVSGGHRFRQFASSYHTCGVDTDGRAWCWGSGLGGQLGTAGAGGSSGSFVPLPVASSATYTAITNGLQFSCAIRSGGQADCWGFLVGRGDGSVTPSTDVPGPVSGGLAFRDISAGEGHVCAVTTAGRAYCWGNITRVAGLQYIPVEVPGTYQFASVASGSRFGPTAASCGLSADGRASCWHGEFSPLPVPGNHRWAGIVGGHDRFCGYTPGGSAFCWTWIGSTTPANGGWVLSIPAPVPSLPSGSPLRSAAVRESA